MENVLGNLCNSLATIVSEFMLIIRVSLAMVLLLTVMCGLTAIADLAE